MRLKKSTQVTDLVYPTILLLSFPPGSSCSLELLQREWFLRFPEDVTPPVFLPLPQRHRDTRTKSNQNNDNHRMETVKPRK